MKTKRWVIIVIVLVVIAGAGGIAWWLLTQNSSDPILGGFGEGGNSSEPIYSNFTGLEISDAKLNDSPTFCVQIPNGSTDGARPQAGLTHAGVVFEAIAETGITRFAAIFQNPQTGVIGPIRSLRPYYLDWDTPFDCTIVHDGGSAEALASVGSGRYRNLDENFNYMWKEAYINGQYRYWNNVFTSPEKLLDFNHSHNYNTSKPKTFPRLEPAELADLNNRSADCTDAPEATTNCVSPNQATSIHTTFTNLSDYKVNYTYDPASNTYKRAYERGGDHMAYNCPASTTDFTKCSQIQVAPNVVVAMRVQESTMADGYHEQIKTIGDGVAYIFQNGQVTEGTWQKTSQDSQIKFHDLSGAEIKFVPGQIWIAAVPQFGNVSWE